jgi:hypothetical protein
MCINGGAGGIWNRWMDLSGIRVRSRNMVGGPESLIVMTSNNVSELSLYLRSVLSEVLLSTVVD